LAVAEIVASPLELVVAVLAESVALAPLAGAEKVTTAPETGLCSASSTTATSDEENPVSTVVDCELPDETAMDAGAPALFVSEKDAAVATPDTLAVTV
jgi:hypothetical protein